MLNYLPIVPKAFIFVPKVMRKQVSLPKGMKFRNLAQTVNLERDG